MEVLKAKNTFFFVSKRNRVLRIENKISYTAVHIYIMFGEKKNGGFAVLINLNEVISKIQSELCICVWMIIKLVNQNALTSYENNIMFSLIIRWTIVKSLYKTQSEIALI